MCTESSICIKLEFLVLAALNNIIFRAEETLECKEITLYACMDIVRAFDNINPDTVDRKIM